MLPSAGVAPDQVTTLTQGHDCLRFVPSVSTHLNNNRRGRKKIWKWGRGRGESWVVVAVVFEGALWAGVLCSCFVFQ